MNTHRTGRKEGLYTCTILPANPIYLYTLPCQTRCAARLRYGEATYRPHGSRVDKWVLRRSHWPSIEVSRPPPSFSRHLLYYFHYSFFEFSHTAKHPGYPSQVRLGVVSPLEEHKFCLTVTGPHNSYTWKSYALHTLRLMYRTVLAIFART